MKRNSSVKVYKLQVNGMVFPVNIYVEKRKNSRVSIGKKGVNIRLPFWLSNKEKDQQIFKFLEWARCHLRKHSKKFEKKNNINYRDGDNLKVGKDRYRLHIEYQDQGTSTASLNNGTIQMKISNQIPEEVRQDQISNLISRCVAAHKLPEVRARIEKLNERYFGKKISRITLKNTRSRWGSCSEKGNINLSTRILFAPQEVIDYVCIHELSHLIEPNHSPRFWNLVERIMPDYKKHKKWLKENGEECRF